MMQWRKMLGLDESSSSIKHNWTLDFVQFLQKNNDTPDFSFILLTIGAGGSGKTAVAFMISHILLMADPKRHVLLYRVPETLIPDIQDALKGNGLEAWCSRFKRIEHLREVDINAILIFDEGVLMASAKEALMKEMVDFEQDLSFSRHKRIIVLMNSVDDGILLAYRKKAHITVYKQLNKGFVDNVRNDKFVKEYRNELTKLDVREAIIYSTYKYFNNKVGKIKMDLKVYCPWYNDKISRNMQGSTFSAQFDRFSGGNKLVDEFATKAVDEFGQDLIKRPKMKNILLGWMLEKFPDQYFDLKRNIGNIFDRAVYRQYMNDKETKEMTAKHSKKADDDDDNDLEENEDDDEADGNDAPDVNIQNMPHVDNIAIDTNVLDRETNNPFLRCYDAINTFTYNVDDMLADYGKDLSSETRKLHVAIYKRFHELGALDKTAAEFKSPVDPSKTMSVNGVRLINRKVTGFLGDVVGLDFEPVIEKELKKKCPNAKIYHGKTRKPDFVVFQPGTEMVQGQDDPPFAIFGNIFVYSVKCYDSIRSKTLLPASEMHPEIKYCQDAHDLAKNRGTKLDIQLISLYFNMANRNFTQEGVDFLHPKDITIDETKDVQ